MVKKIDADRDFNIPYMKKRSILVAGPAALLMVACIYGFFFGPLFSYCPVTPGFDRMDLERCTILYPSGAVLPPEYSTLDTLMDETERFHRMSFRKRVKVVVCATPGQYKRLSLGGGHASTPQTGTAIYIAPSIEETTYPPSLQREGETSETSSLRKTGRRDLAGFLKHELSHAILYQNTGLFRAFHIRNWVDEGLAIYFGNPDHYYRGEEFRTLAFQQGCFFNLLDDESEPVVTPPGIKFYFKYGAYCEFMAYLVDKYGLDCVLEFVHAYIQSPSDEKTLFQASFGCSPAVMLDRFREDQQSVPGA